ncbi:methyl-CpG-binding domain-containing protein 2 isoform X1 [Benincasa hispida]|uniref:methyl-CpG-binding domain-containing protein 2 isoform X1 n=1 Tax=Benincasa hispida TaxID=102211 RepID=UPI0019019C01|nr:methyl-CpG-binding domain-containing protein 2 isoform X1 [Benincasa hispida]XP_038890274.1 methyl-CpG-binding domain-containing protein 2 isoform X1 [Benincasa hispida]XP_038890275.1 methyl-CpG-binding domain-containing protein 2 isoform X1 [Benincasa hispida]XP_038890276.1 methyl-CpG-binding domain-containing protein 2 isoform X1 [Benincasa hispida]
MVGGEENDLNEPSLSNGQETPRQDVRAVSSFSSSLSSSSFENELHEPRNENAQSQSNENPSRNKNAQSQSNENPSRELVLYDSSANDGGANEPVSTPVEHQRPPLLGHLTPNSSRVLPSVGAFTVQCASCFKWRLIPTKEKYEEIREHLLEKPFYCETAREWRPDISCDDPADITQDGSRLWAIDKPNIAQPPPGWQRLLHIRGEGSTKFADVYYIAPSGKKLRSMVDIQKYLIEHPEYQTEGVSMTRFSFQIPKPLRENYVRKRRPNMNASCDGSKLESGGVHPISWARPDDSTALQLGKPGLSELLLTAPVDNPITRPVKKVKRALAREMRRSSLASTEPPAVKLERCFDKYEK